MLSVKDADYLTKETKSAINAYLMKTACLMPVRVLKQIQTTTTIPFSSDSLMHAPAYQMSKLIYKRYAIEALA